ncbi:MAG: CxxxxCH/CxxCH domain-containing protein [Fidelibacterota bacterium]
MQLKTNNFFALHQPTNRPSIHNLGWGLVFCILVLTGSQCTKINTDRQQHGAGWADSTSENFHGARVAQSGIKSCAACHGEDYQGGSVNVSCYQCHAGGPSGHPVGFTDFSSGAFHGFQLRDNGWNFSLCQACHGTDFKGGTIAYSCSQSYCHTGSAGIETCHTCHGDGTTAGFSDLYGNTSTNSLGVGAHSAHLRIPDALTATLDCDACHQKPDSLFAPNHLETDNRAEITFGALATDNGNISPDWDYDSATCTNTYCHGNFTFDKQSSQNQWVFTADSITGNKKAVVWTTSGEAVCGSCHDLPPQGHKQDLTNCGGTGCHSSVIGSDNISIIDPSKHINGEIDN